MPFSIAFYLFCLRFVHLFVGVLVDWLFDWLFGWLVVWLAGWEGEWVVGWSIGNWLVGLAYSLLLLFVHLAYLQSNVELCFVRFCTSLTCCFVL